MAANLHLYDIIYLPVSCPGLFEKSRKRGETLLGEKATTTPDRGC